MQAMVLSSIKPIDLITRDLTGGDPASFVLLDASASPHHYALKMSELQRLRESDLFVWIGPDLETFLNKALTKRSGPTLTISDMFKEASKKSESHHRGHDHHDVHSHGESTLDAHLWLSYDNAGKIATALAEKLSELYPSRSGQLAENLSLFLESLTEDKQLTREMLSELKAKNFGVYHDGYSAYVDEFQLNQVAHITLAPDEQISLKKMANLKRALADAQCLLGEQAEYKTVEKFAARLGIKPVAIDLLANSIERSQQKNHFIRYMASIRTSFLQCLADS